MSRTVEKVEFRTCYKTRVSHCYSWASCLPECMGCGDRGSIRNSSWWPWGSQRLRQIRGWCLQERYSCRTHSCRNIKFVLPLLAARSRKPDKCYNNWQEKKRANHTIQVQNVYHAQVSNLKFRILKMCMILVE